ncbi:MAG: hypothetical protein ABII23_03470, partial [bacterium]
MKHIMNIYKKYIVLIISICMVAGGMPDIRGDDSPHCLAPPGVLGIAEEYKHVQGQHRNLLPEYRVSQKTPAFYAETAWAVYCFNQRNPLRMNELLNNFTAEFAGFSLYSDEYTAECENILREISRGTALHQIISRDPALSQETQEQAYQALDWAVRFIEIHNSLKHYYQLESAHAQYMGSTQNEYELQKIIRSLSQADFIKLINEYPLLPHVSPEGRRGLETIDKEIQALQFIRRYADDGKLSKKLSEEQIEANQVEAALKHAGLHPLVFPCFSKAVQAHKLRLSSPPFDYIQQLLSNAARKGSKDQLVNDVSRQMDLFSRSYPHGFAWIRSSERIEARTYDAKLLKHLLNNESADGLKLYLEGKKLSDDQVNLQRAELLQAYMFHPAVLGEFFAELIQRGSPEKWAGSKQISQFIERLAGMIDMLPEEWGTAVNEISRKRAVYKTNHALDASLDIPVPEITEKTYDEFLRKDIMKILWFLNACPKEAYTVSDLLLQLGNNLQVVTAHETLMHIINNAVRAGAPVEWTSQREQFTKIDAPWIYTGVPLSGVFKEAFDAGIMPLLFPGPIADSFNNDCFKEEDFNNARIETYCMQIIWAVYTLCQEYPSVWRYIIDAYPETLGKSDLNKLSADQRLEILNNIAQRTSYLKLVSLPGSKEMNQDQKRKLYITLLHIAGFPEIQRILTQYNHLSQASESWTKEEQRKAERDLMLEALRSLTKKELACLRRSYYMLPAFSERLRRNSPIFRGEVSIIELLYASKGKSLEHVTADSDLDESAVHAVIKCLLTHPMIINKLDSLVRRHRLRLAHPIRMEMPKRLLRLLEEYNYLSKFVYDFDITVSAFARAYPSCMLNVHKKKVSFGKDDFIIFKRFVESKSVEPEDLIEVGLLPLKKEDIHLRLYLIFHAFMFHPDMLNAYFEDMPDETQTHHWLDLGAMYTQWLERLHWMDELLPPAYQNKIHDAWFRLTAWRLKALGILTIEQAHAQKESWEMIKRRLQITEHNEFLTIAGLLKTRKSGIVDLQELLHAQAGKFLVVTGMEGIQHVINRLILLRAPIHWIDQQHIEVLKLPWPEDIPLPDTSKPVFEPVAETAYSVEDIFAEWDSLMGLGKKSGDAVILKKLVIII